jgi:hypothetical protein
MKMQKRRDQGYVLEAGAIMVCTIVLIAILLAFGAHDSGLWVAEALNAPQ